MELSLSSKLTAANSSMIDSVIIVEEGQRVRTRGAERLQENSISVRGKETAHINSLQLG